MNITFEQPQPNHGKYLIHLATPDMIDALSRNDVTGVAAVFEDDEGSRMVVGLMVTERMGKDSVRLQWLYIDKDYRRQGIAVQLLKILRETAEFNHVKSITAMLYPQKMIDWPYETMADFLKRHGLPDMKVQDGPWIISGRQLRSGEFYQKTLAKEARFWSSIREFRSYSATEQRKLIAEFAPRQNVSLKDADQSVSCAVNDREGAQGILVIEKRGDTYHLIALRANSMQLEMFLLSYMVLRLGEIMAPTEFICLDPSHDEFIERMEKAIPAVTRQRAVCVKASIA